MKSKKHAIILIDDECLLCNRIAGLIAKYDIQDYYRLTGLQGRIGKKILENNKLSNIKLNSIVLLENDQIYFSSAAACMIFTKLNIYKTPLKIYKLFSYRIRERIYFLIANYRYKIFGKAKSCKIENGIQSKFIHSDQDL